MDPQNILAIHSSGIVKPSFSEKPVSENLSQKVIEDNGINLWPPQAYLHMEEYAHIHTVL